MRILNPVTKATPKASRRAHTQCSHSPTAVAALVEGSGKQHQELPMAPRRATGSTCKPHQNCNGNYMLTDSQHVLPIAAWSTKRNPMGMPRNMPREPRGDQPGATEAPPTEGHGSGGAVTFCRGAPERPPGGVRWSQGTSGKPSGARKQSKNKCPEPPRKQTSHRHLSKSYFGAQRSPKKAPKRPQSRPGAGPIDPQRPQQAPPNRQRAARTPKKTNSWTPY